MTKNSLAYVNTRNQTSFKDDPFDIGLEFTQGTSMLSHERQLELYAEELVSRFARYECEEYTLDLFNLPVSEQAKFLQCYIESIDREFEADSIYGNDYSINNDYTCSLLALLADNNAETREHLSFVTLRNMTTYYEKELQNILTEACVSYLHYTNQEAGLRCYQDKDHGDLCWGKF